MPLEELLVWFMVLRKVNYHTLNRSKMLSKEWFVVILLYFVGKNDPIVIINADIPLVKGFVIQRR